MDKKIILIIFLSILFISIILFFVFRKKNINILERWAGPGNVPWLSPTKYMVQLYRGNTNIFSTESPEMYSTVSSNPVFNIGNIPDGYSFYIYRKVKTNNVYPDSWGNPLTYGTDYTSTTNLDGTISITDIKNPWNPPYTKPLNDGVYYIYKLATDTDTQANINTPLASINLSSISYNLYYTKLTDTTISNPITSMNQVRITLIGFRQTSSSSGYIYSINNSNQYLYANGSPTLQCLYTTTPAKECYYYIQTSGSQFTIKTYINNYNVIASNNILSLSSNINCTWTITTNTTINLIKPVLPSIVNKYISLNYDTDFSIENGCGNFYTNFPVYFSLSSRNSDGVAYCTDIIADASPVKFEPIYGIATNSKIVDIYYYMSYNNYYLSINSTDHLCITTLKTPEAIWYKYDRYEAGTYRTYFQNKIKNNIIGYCYMNSGQQLVVKNSSYLPYNYATSWTLSDVSPQYETANFWFVTTMSNIGGKKNYLSDCTAKEISLLTTGPQYGRGLIYTSKTDINDRSVYYKPYEGIYSTIVLSTVLWNFKLIKVFSNPYDPYFYIQSIRSDGYKTYLVYISSGESASKFVMCNNILNNENRNGWVVNRDTYQFRIKTVYGDTGMYSIQDIRTQNNKSPTNNYYYIQPKLGGDIYMAACNNRVVIVPTNSIDKITETEFIWSLNIL